MREGMQRVGGFKYVHGLVGEEGRPANTEGGRRSDLIARAFRTGMTSRDSG
jgi:hypothetical protein